MRRINRIFSIMMILAVSACSLPQIPQLAQLPILVQPETGQAQGITTPEAGAVVSVAADATATPTPFQPLPPTPVITPTEMPTLTPAPTNTPIPAVAELPVVPLVPGEVLADTPKQVNILLLGSDRRPGGSSFRTDTIILLSLNTEKGTANLLSFPRDLFVYIPGWTQDRINVAWQHGGFKGLAATMQQNFGVKPTHYLLINFRTFKQVIDDLGGLDVKVGQQVRDKYPGKGYITISKGKVHMNADMALWYARSRKTSNDFARNKRQQEVLMALFEKFVSVNALTRVPELWKAYKKGATTNIELGDGLSLLPLAVVLATDPSRIKRFYIEPGMVSDYITPAGAMVLLPDEAKIRKVVKQTVGGK